MKPADAPWRVALRHSHAWLAMGGVAAWITVAKLGESATSTRSSALWLPALLTAAGLGFLIFALPYAAIRVVELERDGRLDQLRLAGRPPAALLAVLAAPALPWLAGGVLFLIGSVVVGGVDHAIFGSAPAFPLRRVIVVILASGIGAMFIIALTRALRQVDILLLTVAGGVMAAVLAMFTANAPALAWPNAASRNLALAAIIAAELALAAVAVRRAMNAVALARTTPARRAARLLRDWSAITPALRRGLATALWPAVVLAVMALSLLVARYMSRVGDPTNHDDVAYALVTFVLGISAIVVSSVVRADVDSGRFEVLRLAPRTSISTALVMTLELWLPFLISASLVLGGARVLLGVSVTEGIAAITMIVAVAAPVAILEGTHRALMLTYSAPAALAASTLVPRMIESALVDVLVYAVVAWIPYAVLAEYIRHGIGARLGSPLSAGAVAGITIAAQWTGLSPTTVGLEPPSAAVVLLLTIAWFDDGAGRRSLSLLLPTVFAASAVVALVVGYPFVDAVLVSMLPAAAVVTGSLLNQRIPLPAWSLAARVATAVGCVALHTVTLIAGVTTAGGLRDRRLPVAMTLAVLAGVAGLVVLVTAAGRRMRSRRSPATPPP